MIIFRPKSFVYLFFIVLINLLLIGIIYLLITGVLKQNLSYVLIGTISFLIIIIQDISLLKHKITIFDDHIEITSGYYQKILNGNISLKIIYFNEIENFQLKTIPSQILIIKSKNSKEYYSIYLKQFSKNQVNQIINIFKTKTGKI